MKKGLKTKIVSFVLAIALLVSQCSVLLSGMTPVLAEEINDTFSLYYYYEGEGILYANIWNHAGITFADSNTLVSWGWDYKQAQFTAVEDYEHVYKIDLAIVGAADDGITIYENDSSTTLVQYDNKWNNTEDYATLVGKTSKTYVVKDNTIFTSFEAAGITKKESEAEKIYEWKATSLVANGDFETADETGWTVSGDADVTYKIKKDAYATNNTTNIFNIYNGGSAAEAFSLSQTITLPAGTYKLAWKQEGDTKESGLTMSVSAESVVTSTALEATTGWDGWASYESEEFTFEESTTVTIAFSGNLTAGYWGDIDDIVLYSYEEVKENEGDEDNKDEEEEVKPVEADVYVERVTGMCDDFITGADVSSYLSIINSGAAFYDKDGNKLDEQGFFNLLAAGGTNYIRIRVWNDPYDSNGKGYGGGNNDLETAKIMGQYATKAGMKVLIDFHYSDFWADPGKQQAPKAWSSMSAAEKATAVADYTKTSLKYLLDNGVDVGMVQVGNETTNSICDVSFSGATQDACAIFDAGCDAVHAVASEYNKEILAAIHFTNPERSGNYANFAKRLNTYDVSYDVFASSYYPYWHGTIDNLTSVLKNVADTYGKKVMVAETSWAWTLEDGDGHANTVRVGSNDSGQPYEFSVQGQCNEIRAVAQAVANVGDAGIGLFYWENAWIPVEYAYDEEGNLVEAILDSNKEKWESKGSGWASSYAGEYDAKDAGVWFGGSAVDNQSWFDFSGKAIDTVNIYNYIRTGTTVKPIVTGVSVEDTNVSISEAASLTLPETATVSYNVGTKAQVAVVWDEAAFADAKTKGIGSYEIAGTVTVDDTIYNVIWKLTIEANNLLLNPGFESGLDSWTVSGFNTQDASSNSHNGSGCLHFYTSTAGTKMTASQKITVNSGVYSASVFLQGGNAGESDRFAIEVTVGEKTYEAAAGVSGWKVWSNPTITNIKVPEDNTEVTVTLTLSDATAGVWGSFDDAKLIRTGDYNAELYCPDYGFYTTDHISEEGLISGYYELKDGTQTIYALAKSDSEKESFGFADKNPIVAQVWLSNGKTKQIANGSDLFSYRALENGKGYAITLNGYAKAWPDDMEDYGAFSLLLRTKTTNKESGASENSDCNIDIRRNYNSSVLKSGLYVSSRFRWNADQIAEIEFDGNFSGKKTSGVYNECIVAFRYVDNENAASCPALEELQFDRSKMKLTLRTIVEYKGTDIAIYDVKFFAGLGNYTISYANSSVTVELIPENEDLLYITYVYQDGIRENEIFEMEPLESLPSLERTGYTFDGWYNEAGKKVTQATTSELLYAKWTPNTYNVVLKPNGGSGSQVTLSATYDKPVAFEKAKFAKTGYTLAGWSYSADGEMEIVNENNVRNLTSEKGVTVTLYAVWVPTEYRIIYHKSGALGNENDEDATFTIFDQAYTLKDAIGQEGYTFGGWYKENTYQTPITEIPAGTHEDVHVYAKWLPATYTIHFDANGGTGGSVSDQTMYYNLAAKLNANKFSRANYVFVGWSTDKEYDKESSILFANAQSVTNSNLGISAEVASVTLYAVWKQVFEIHYNLNGGILQDGESEYREYTYKQPKYDALATPERTGYTFGGWYLDENFKTKFTKITKTTTGDKELYAKWTPNTYTVTFDANGGSGKAKKQTLTYDKEADLTALSKLKFTRKGYEFTGWKASDSDEVYMDEQSVVNLASKKGENITLKAQWEAIEYTISFETNGGYFGNEANVDGEEMHYCINTSSAIALPTPEREGYIFDGWYKDAKCTSKVASIAKNTAADMLLYAKWKGDAYTVQFIANAPEGTSVGNSKTKNQTMIHGTPKALNANGFKITGYTFVGWSIEPMDVVNGLEVDYENGGILPNKAIISEPEFTKEDGKNILKLYAVWSKTYAIAYDTKGGDFLGDVVESYAYAEQTILPVPVREGYTFAGWYKDAKLKSQVANATGKMAANVSGNLKLYAKWTAKSYKVIFDANAANSEGTKPAGTMAAKNYTFGKAAELTKVGFKRAGYAFLGWSLNPEDDAVAFTNKQKITGMPDGSYPEDGALTLYAVWGNQFEISYELNGGDWPKEAEILESYQYNKSSYEKLPVPVKEGYTFAGWYKDAAYKSKVSSLTKTMYGDLELHAKWTGKSYTVTFDANAPEGAKTSGKMKNQKLTYGTGKALTKNTYKVNGYTFIGWSTEPNGDVELQNAEKFAGFDTYAGQVTLYAVWEKNVYTITYKGIDPVDQKENLCEEYTVTDTVALAEPEKIGYTFMGWYTDAKYKKKASDLKAGTTGDKTFYAKWVANTK